MGRPSSFTQQIADEICERIASGESLRSICTKPATETVYHARKQSMVTREVEAKLPDAVTVYRWLEHNETFRKQYADARNLQAESLFDKAQDIAENATAETVQVARLQIDTLKWQAGKLRPKVYGDKIDVNHSGEVTQTHDLSAYSPDELDALEKLVGKNSDRAADSSGTSAPGADRVH